MCYISQRKCQQNNAGAVVAAGCDSYRFVACRLSHASLQLENLVALPYFFGILRNQLTYCGLKAASSRYARTND